MALPPSMPRQLGASKKGAVATTPVVHLPPRLLNYFIWSHSVQLTIPHCKNPIFKGGSMDHHRHHPSSPKIRIRSSKRRLQQAGSSPISKRSIIVPEISRVPPKSSKTPPAPRTHSQPGEIASRNSRASKGRRSPSYMESTLDLIADDTSKGGKDFEKSKSLNDMVKYHHHHQGELGRESERPTTSSEASIKVMAHPNESVLYNTTAAPQSHLLQVSNDNQVPGIPPSLYPDSLTNSALPSVNNSEELYHPTVSLSQAAIISGLTSMSHNRRQAHIASEQKRRQSINEGFEELRRTVPSCVSISDSKAVVLRKALNYIQQLQNELQILKSMLSVGARTASSSSRISYTQSPPNFHPSYSEGSTAINNTLAGIDNSIHGRHSPAAHHQSTLPNKNFTLPSYAHPNFHLQSSSPYPSNPPSNPKQNHPPPVHASTIYGYHSPPPHHHQIGRPLSTGPTSVSHVVSPQIYPQHPPTLPPMQYSGREWSGGYYGRGEIRPLLQSQLPILHHGQSSLALPQPISQPVDPYPTPSDYNREDYASAASLSLLRKDISDNVRPLLRDSQHPL